MACALSNYLYNCRDIDTSEYCCLQCLASFRTVGRRLKAAVKRENM